MYNNNNNNNQFFFLALSIGDALGTKKNNNNNNQISIAQYGGGKSNQCSVKASVNKKVLSLDWKTGFSPSKTDINLAWFKLSRLSTTAD